MRDGLCVVQRAIMYAERFLTIVYDAGGEVEVEAGGAT